MIEVITNSLPVFIAIALGKFLKSQKIIPESAINPIATLTFKIIGPFFVFSAIYSIQLENSARYLFLSPAIIFLSITLLGFLFCKYILKMDKSRLGAAVICLFSFGAGSMYPLVFQNYDETTFGNFIIVDIVSFLTFLTIGVILANILGKKKGHPFQKMISIIKDPYLISMAIAFLLNLLKVKLPDFVLDTADYIGNPFFFMTSLFVGLTLQLPKIEEFKLIIATYAFRLITVIGLILSLGFAFSLKNNELRPLWLVHFAQSSVLCVALSREQDLDFKFASQMVLLSMIGQLVIYPIAMMII